MGMAIGIIKGVNTAITFRKDVLGDVLGDF
jgi:hypothetical protein